MHTKLWRINVYASSRLTRVYFPQQCRLGVLLTCIYICYKFKQGLPKWLGCTSTSTSDKSLSDDAKCLYCRYATLRLYLACGLNSTYTQSVVQWYAVVSGQLHTPKFRYIPLLFSNIQNIGKKMCRSIYTVNMPTRILSMTLFYPWDPKFDLPNH